MTDEPLGSGDMGSSRGYRTGTRARAGVLLGLVLLAGCIDEYNPFSDLSNVGVYFTAQSVGDGDTVDIFTTETLQVRIAVKEHVDSLQVAAADNRLWTGVDTIINGKEYADEPYTFYVSFYDTGLHHVVFSAIEGIRELSAETLSLYVESPLAQQSISGAYGDTVSLATLPVGDPDVRYYWLLGDDTLSSDSANMEAVVTTSGGPDSGQLWVWDGVFPPSPVVGFSLALYDSIGPSIECLNVGYTGGDTVFTADTAFGFKVRIADRGTGGVDSASVNGAAFTDRVGDVYYLFLTDMHQHTWADPVRAEVFAVDRLDLPFGNETRRTFYIIFGDSVPQTKRFVLGLTIPSADSVVSGTRTFQLAGTIEARAAETLSVVMEIDVGGDMVRDTIPIDEVVEYWSRDIVLDSLNNAVHLRLLDTLLTDTLDEIHRTIRYDPAVGDSVPPRFFRTRIGGSNAHRYFSTVPSVFLRVEVIDAGSGVDSVSYDGQPVPAYKENWWADTIVLVHQAGGNPITIRATDTVGNVADTVVRVYYNRRAVFDLVPRNRYISVDSAYRDTVAAIDPDGDQTSFSKYRGPEGLTVSASGSISWTPTSEDTGTHTITLRVYDGFQYTGQLYVLYVSSWDSTPPVRFATKVSSFPSFLQAASDTLSINLRVDSSTGVQPYRFSARMMNSGEVLLNNSTNSRLTWVPDSGDTGYRQLMVIVRDDIASSDTILPRILVVPVNRPCSLSVSYRSPTVSGIADLNSYGGVDTLTFRIYDPDDPKMERHAVSVLLRRSNSMTVIDSTVTDSFYVLVSPTVFDGLDTVVATVRDIAGHTDTLVQLLYYGMPPYVPQPLQPSDGGVGVSIPVTFVWQGGDFDGDSLTYDLYIGSSAGSLSLIDSVVDTTYTTGVLMAGAQYFWQVVARDWRKSTPGPVFDFTTQ